MLAADAIRLALEKDRFDGAFLKEVYDAAVYRELGKELRLSARLQSLCRYPWLLNMVVNKALKSPALGNLFSRMFEDLDLRNELRKPSFYLNILLNR